jgi:outer membrane lipoprotein carrier protein
MNRMITMILLGACLVASAAAQEADSFFALARTKYLAADDFKAAYTGIRTSGATGSMFHSTGTIEVGRPDKFRIECDKPEDKTIVYDGKLLWVYTPKSKEVVATTIRNSPELLAMLNPYDKLFGAMVIDGSRTNGEFQIWLYVTDYIDTLKEVKMLVNRESAEIWGINATDVHDNAYEYSFTKIKFNAGIKPARFEFTVPSGTKVIEKY